MSITTTAQVFALRQIDAPSPTVVAVCQQIIDVVEAEAETHLRRTFGRTAATDTVTHLVDVWGPSYLPLSRTPVGEITSVTVDGVLLDRTGWSWERSGVVLGAMTAGPHEVEVVYTGGIPEGPVLTAVLGVVQRRSARLLGKVLDAAVGAERSSIEGYDITWIREDWTDEEIKALDRHRRRVAYAPVASGTYGIVGGTATFSL